jgi:hypothetical protein
MKTRILCIAIGTAALASAGYGETDIHAPDIPEPGSVEAIAEYTTAPEYLPVSVSYLPESDTVPSPRDILGRVSGAPGELSTVSEVHGYFRRLAQASPRVLADTIGTSVEGREILLAVVSSRESLGALGRWRETTRRLADPRGTDREAMAALAREGKLIYHLVGGLHSTETGPPEMLMELAYRLAVSEKPEIQAIRDNVIVLITPVVEPDGRDRTVQWYYRHLKGRDLPYRELDRFDSPPYWGYYVFHDNNRDGMQLTLPLTRAVSETYWSFHPQIVHDLHESLPLLYISTGHGPYSLAVDPVTISEWTQFAFHEVSELQAMGLPGVWTWGFWDGWWPGYLVSVASNHNSVGRFYETFGNMVAETLERDLEKSTFIGKPVTEVQWYRPWPPDEKVRWSMRNNTNYMQAGVLEGLEYAARHREELLRNFWVKGKRAVTKGRSEAPHAWVFPVDQRDPARLAYLVNRLLEHRIEVQRLSADLELGEASWSTGAYVVRMDQPYRAAAINFLQDQVFPPDEPHPPYDDVAWTWPLLYGVEGSRVDDEGILDARMQPVTEPVRAVGEVEGEGPVFLLEDRGQTSLLQARVVLGRHPVEAVEAPFEHGGKTYPSGSWVCRAPRRVVEETASELGLQFVGTAEIPPVPRHSLDLPRIAVYHTWTATQDCGWVRYTFDEHGIPYTLISDDDVKRGGLDRFDVILFPRTWGNLARIVHGIDPKYGPLAYTRTPEFPSHGIPDSSPDITGGMGFKGLANLEAFIRDGGVFVTLAGSGVLPVDAGLVRNVKRLDVGRIPGSVLRGKVLRPEHPIAYGYPETVAMFRGHGPVFDVDKEDRQLIVTQFGTALPDDEGAPEGTDAPGTGKPRIRPEVDSARAAKDTEGESPGESERLVLSGYTELDAPGRKEDKAKLEGKPAILDVPVGDGRVILFSFNPMHRYLNHSDFRYLYNVLLNWNDLP